MLSTIAITNVTMIHISENGTSGRHTIFLATNLITSNQNKHDICYLAAHRARILLIGPGPLPPSNHDTPRHRYPDYT